MDLWAVAIGVLGAALVIFSGALVGWRRLTGRLQAAVGAPPGTDPIAAGQALRTRNGYLEAELATERHQRDLLLDGLAQGVVSVDEGLRIRTANRAAHAFLGRGPAGLLGRTLIEAFMKPEVESLAATALEQGSATAEVERVGSDGRPGSDGRRLLVTALRSSPGGAWLILEDVSELRRLQQIRTEFIDNLSHELRTPLTTVSLLAETLAREADAADAAIPARMRDRIGKIEVETGHLVQMVSELMDLSRIERGGTIRLVDPVDLGLIATESIERLRLFADRQGVALRVEVEDGGPVPPVRGDESRLAQVFLNLLHNAVKFSPDGGEVRVTIRVEDGRVVSSVTDHGVGIPAAAQARIFERFYKVDRARVRGEAGGTGLGLAIARHIIEQHGGAIWVESIERTGSTFHFALPIAVSGNHS